jgi:hypothetical protein
VEALGGRIFLDSPRGAGTSLRVELPLTASNGGVATSLAAVFFACQRAPAARVVARCFSVLGERRARSPVGWPVVADCPSRWPSSCCVGLRPWCWLYFRRYG